MQHDTPDGETPGGETPGADTTDGARGYGLPPRHSRFKPGQSGNPQGRAKGSRNLATLLEAELRRPVILTEGGRRRRVPKAAAMVASQVNKALKGDTRAFNTVLQATTRRSRGTADGDGEDPGDADVATAHDQLYERLERLARQDAAERDALIAELVAAGVAETHLDHLFGPRGQRLRDGMMAALQAVHAHGFDIREVADLAVFNEAADDCATALLGEDATGG